MTAHTHTETHILAPSPPAFSLSFCFFLDTSAQNRPDSHTNPRVACLARHVWPRRLNGRPWMRWTHIYKRKLQLGQYHRGETFNTETLQYRRSITYRDVTDVLLSFLCVVCRESGTPRIVLNLCVRCLVLHCGTTGVQYINAHFFLFLTKTQHSFRIISWRKCRSTDLCEVMHEKTRCRSLLAVVAN